MWVRTGTVLGAGLGGAWSYWQLAASREEVSLDRAYCDYGIGAAKARARK